MTNIDFLRELSATEKRVLEYISDHPGVGSYEIAEALGHTKEVYEAIYYLIFEGLAIRDSETGSIKAMEI